MTVLGAAINPSLTIMRQFGRRNDLLTILFHAGRLMTSISPSTNSAANYASAGTAYARGAATAPDTTADTTASASTSAADAKATNVTLSDEALALLAAAQDTTKTFAAVTA